MRIALLIARLVLGLIFVVFGLNGFINFIPAPDPHIFLELLISSKYLLIVKAFEVVGGGLLLAGRFVPLGLALLGPIVFNIALYHAFFNAEGWPLAVLNAVLWGFLFWGYRNYFAPLFTANAEPAA